MNLCKIISTLTLIYICIALSGCVAPPRILVSQDFIGERSVQYLMQKSGTTVAKNKEDKTQLFNFYMRICNITDEGKESDCQETSILRNVQAKSVY